LEALISHEKFGYVIRVLLYLLEVDKPPTIMDFMESRIVPRATFYNHLKRNLEKAGLVEFRVNPDRTISMHLTDEGRKLAECLKQCEDILQKIGVV